MYAAHSKASWGAGNLGDWQRLSDWAAPLGAKVLATLPLLAGFFDYPTCEPSPYSPVSRLFWNEFYLDVTHAPEFAHCPEVRRLVQSSEFQLRLEKFRRNPIVAHTEEMAARRQVLEKLADFLFSRDSKRRRELQTFLGQRREVEEYARFRAACEQTKTSWSEWPDRMKNGELLRGDYCESTRRYHLYVQWLAEEQVNHLSESCAARGVKLYLDLPLGVHPDGYDMWRHRTIFASGASTGAPPDSFFTLGQNWGFAPLHPQRIRDQHYQYVIDYLRFQMKHAGLLRLDHIMSLHRLYWIPPGMTASQGAYVNYRAEELYAILCLESHRHKTILIGENLGTVPPPVNQCMQRHQFRKMYVLQYEQRPARKQLLRLPPAKSVASLNTHDMPTFAAYWKGLDIIDRADLGLIARAELKQAREERKRMNAALLAFLRREGWLTGGKPNAKSVLKACLSFLAASSSETLLLNLEDLWLEERPQNVPGTFEERPNWQRKTRYTLEQIFRMDQVQRLLRTLSKLRNTPPSHRK